MTDDKEDGWCRETTVYLDDGRVSDVLGPDGEPVRYVTRHAIGFDLRPRNPPKPHLTRHPPRANV